MNKTPERIWRGVLNGSGQPIYDTEMNSESDVAYIQEGVEKAYIDRLERTIAALEKLRPLWAQGYSSDSIAAQAKTNALSSIWSYLGVQDQTACMAALKELKGETT